MIVRLTLCALVVASAASVQAQFVVDSDLGVLGSGTYDLIGDTTGAGDEAGGYAGLTNPAATWVEDVVFQFTTTAELEYQLLNVAIDGDPDFFLLDSLDVSFDGAQNVADGAIAADFLDGGADGAALTIPAGTYYISVDAFGGFSIPGDSSGTIGAFDVDLVLGPPPIASDLGNLPLDDGFYARGGGDEADHPYGELPFSVDTSGDYDILADWIDPVDGAFDGFLYLFDEPFAEDDSTAIASDDDFGGTASSLIEGVSLTAGQTYYLVGTTFGGAAGVEGLSGDITLFGPGTSSVIPEPTTIVLAIMGMIALPVVARRR